MKLVTDACSLINIHNAGGLSVVSGLEADSIAVPPLVLGECNGECAAELEKLAETNEIEFLDDSEVPADLFGELFAEYALGEGETECLAFCSLTDWVFCCDDKKARQCGKNLLGEQRVIGSLRVLQKCVQENLIQCHDANSMYKAMLDHGGFLPKISRKFFCES